MLDAIPPLVADAASFEQAAQGVCRQLYGAFTEATALVRMYAIVPLEGLPTELQSWVHKRGRRAG